MEREDESIFIDSMEVEKWKNFTYIEKFDFNENLRVSGA